MKYICEPGRVWIIRRRLGRVKPDNIVRYPYPGRPHLFYGRRYVVPRNPRTPPQRLMRQLFGALSKDWLGLLTPPQRDAWTALARDFNRRCAPVWLDYARRLNLCSPHALTPYHRRIIRRWLVGGRPLSAQQAYVKVNSVLGRMGRPKRLWPPPPSAPFRLNPVQAVRLRWETVAAPSDQPSTIQNPQSTIQNQTSPPAPRLRLELVLRHRVKGDLLLFGSAPCSAGWSHMRRPVYLGLLPAPREGVHDLTALYLARFRVPGPNQQVFIRSCQHRYGWESPPQDHRALLPPKPAPQSYPNLNPNLNLAPLPPLAPNGQFPILNSQFSIGPRRFPSSILHPLSSTLFGCSLLPLGTHRPHTPCTRGTRFRRASVAAGVTRRSCLACHRRKSHCRELWRGS